VHGGTNRLGELRLAGEGFGEKTGTPQHYED